MATASRVGSGRAGWVAFADEAFGTSTERQAGTSRHSVCSTASFWSAVPPSESSWTQSEPGSVWTTQSEQSSVSMGASSCDLATLNAEERHNESSSRPQSPNSSMFPEDEGIEMDSVSWTSNTKLPGTQSETPISSGRFSSWVTFDDDEEDKPHLHRREQPSHIRLDNLSPFQDANSNLIGSPPNVWKQNGTQQNQNRHLLDLTPDGNPPRTLLTEPITAPLLPGSTKPYTKKNPFLCEEFNDIQPSPINPFSSYFDCKKEVTSPMIQSNGSAHHRESSPCAFSFSSPFFQSLSSHSQEAKRESILVFSSEFEPTRGGGGGGETVSHVTPPLDRLDLDQLRNLQITDPDDPGSPTLPDDSVEDAEEAKEDGMEGEDESAPYLPDHMTSQDGWAMLLRIPEKKNIMSSRHWGPIYVRLSDNGVLQMFYEKGLEKPFRTLKLDPRHEAAEHRLQNYEEAGRVHTLSVDLVQYRERRRIQPKSPVTHQPIREQLVKLGTTCYHDFLSFRHALVEVLRQLPAVTGGALPGTTGSPIGAGLTEEEVQVEVRDEFYGTVAAGDGRILKQLVMTRVHVLAFLSGSAGCRLGLNDVQVKGKEVVSRHDIIPNTTTRWICLRDCELHDEHADELEFLSSRQVVFTPPPCRRFQLLAFRTAFAEKTLPFTLRTVASVRGAEVTLQSWLLMSQGFSSNRDALNLIPCENVAIRYPIPEIWAKNFRRDGVMGERSLKARFNKGASFGTPSTSGSEPVMRVTLGTAKYEQAFKAVVWRLSRLPDKNSALGHPHTFFCRLELVSDREVPASLQSHLEVEFDMPAASASKATVRSLSVEDRTDVKKWINYKSHYSYQVPIEQKTGGLSESSSPTLDQDQPGECAQQ
ncbi:stonin-2 isoform X2 [Coregonus clupeaformis]|uniref:stonin-2 isoform X2 n=1 Tax=Coregonus clupeaformis TaxID=59861 RepID=UPI001E1C7D2C|nr:stonin-2 isoform X2 [Coregonus clupeaformis]